MKKLIALSLAILFLSGCALTTIKPYKEDVPVIKESSPVRESIIKPIIKPAPKPVVIEEEEDDEDIK